MRYTSGYRPPTFAGVRRGGRLMMFTGADPSSASDDNDANNDAGDNDNNNDDTAADPPAKKVSRGPSKLQTFRNVRDTQGLQKIGQKIASGNNLTEDDFKELSTWDSVSDYLNIFFDPLTLPVRCVSRAEGGGICGSEVADTLDRIGEREIKAGGCCGLAGEHMSGSKVFKLVLVGIVFILFVFSMLWITSIHQGLQSCEMGVIELRRIRNEAASMKATSMGLQSYTMSAAMSFTNAASGMNTTIGNTTSIECDPAACEFDTVLMKSSVRAYVDTRLASHILSLLPVVYLGIMVVLHLQQGSNTVIKEAIRYRRLTTNDPATTTTVAVAPSNSMSFVDTLYNARDAFDPQNWHLFWLSMLVLLSLIMGIVTCVLDVALAQKLQGASWEPGSVCRRIEDNMVKYQAPVRVPLNTLPIALVVPNVFYTIWAAMFLMNEVSKYIIRKKSHRARKLEQEMLQIRQQQQSQQA